MTIGQNEVKRLQKITDNMIRDINIINEDYIMLAAHINAIEYIFTINVKSKNRSIAETEMFLNKMVQLIIYDIKNNISITNK